MRCRRCGYRKAEHELGTLRCPLCACGTLPAEHVDGGCPCGCGAAPSGHLPFDQDCGCLPMPNGEIMHACGWALWAGVPCPGRRSEGSSKWLTVRRGSFEPADDPDVEIEWRPGPPAVADAPLACFPSRIDWQIAVATAPAYVAAAPPQVPARSPMGPGEIAGAGGKKQATKLGRAALAAGWVVEALYWRAGDGTEGCALRLARGDVRAVALWERKPGHVGELTGWAATYAYVWRLGTQTFPTKLNHAAVDDLLGTC